MVEWLCILVLKTMDKTVKEKINTEQRHLS